MWLAEWIQIVDCHILDSFDANNLTTAVNLTRKLSPRSAASDILGDAGQFTRIICIQICMK